MDLLLNHVADSVRLTENVQQIRTLNEETINASISVVGDVDVTKLATEATNYRVYDINGFLFPSSLVVPSENLLGGAIPSLTTSGLNLLDYTNNRPLYSETLTTLASNATFSEANGYTVFLPTPQAFQDLVNEVKDLPGVVEYLNGDGFSSGDSGLDNALLAHTVANAAPVENGEKRSVADADIKVSGLEGENPTVTISGRVAKILDKESLKFTNGQAHRIDTVLDFPRKDIVGIAETNTTVLYDFVGRAELANTLKSLTVSTVFAPTNAALAPLFCYDKVERVPTEALKKILTHHVINERRVFEKDLTDSLGQSLAGEEIALSDLDVAMPDVLATNGNIHVVNKPIIPPSLRQALPVGDIIDVVKSLENLSTLVTVSGLGYLDLLRASLEGCSQDGFSGYTLFAPSDAAFQPILDDFEYLLENTDVLTKILTYHVVPKVVKSSAVTEGKVTTLSGFELDVAKQGDSIFVGGSRAEVVGADNIAFNGVVHVIDQVMLPPGVELPSMKDNAAPSSSISSCLGVAMGVFSYLLGEF